MYGIFNCFRSTCTHLWPPHDDFNEMEDSTENLRDRYNAGRIIRTNTPGSEPQYVINSWIIGSGRIRLIDNMAFDFRLNQLVLLAFKILNPLPSEPLCFKETRFNHETTEWEATGRTPIILQVGSNDTRTLEECGFSSRQTYFVWRFRPEEESPVETEREIPKLPAGGR